MNDVALIAYIPVLHKGYFDFIRNSDQDVTYVLGNWIVEEIPYLKKEIRTLSSEQIATMLQAIFPKMKYMILHKEDVKDIPERYQKIILPFDDISSYLVNTYLKNVQNITFQDVFLRWDRNNTKENKEVLCETTEPSEYMERARNLSKRSSDWWRHVGAVIIKDSYIVSEGYNKHVPHEHINYMQGDPRNTSQRGRDIELSSAIHAEAMAIAKAAQMGVSLEGSTIYVTTFPCPVCAKLIVYSGIERVVFSEGYAILDAQYILNSYSITIQKENPR